MKRIKTEILCEKYLEEKSLRGVKDSTIANYKGKVETHILPNIPNKFYKIKEEHVYSLIHSLSNKISRKSLKDIIILLNGILKFGKEKNYIKRCIKVPCPTVCKTEIIVFTEKEQKVLEEYLIRNLNHFNFGILLTLYSGIRIGELSALIYKDINNSVISISKTLQRIKNITDMGENKTIIVIDTPKSESSIRKIPLVQPLLEQYNKICIENKEMYLLTGNDKYIEPRTIERRFERILKECGIEHKKFHVLRHTFATNCVMRGVDIKVLSEILGHSNTSFTQKYYVHLDFLFKSESMKKLVSLKS